MTAPNTCHAPDCATPVPAPGAWCPTCQIELERERHLKAWIAGYYAQRGAPRG